MENSRAPQRSGTTGTHRGLCLTDLYQIVPAILILILILHSRFAMNRSLPYKVENPALTRTI